ncbi:MAG: hypothetical protein AB7P50_06500 [Alphaproteobacteria bacterium]
MPFEITDENWAANYEAVGQSSAQWVIVADWLKRSADLLNCKWLEGQQAFMSADFNDDVLPEVFEKSKNLPRTSYMLFAFAIENLLKARIVKEASCLVSQEQLDKSLRIHNLLKLAERANVTLSPREEEIMRKLTNFGVWAGRYPIPTNRPVGKSHVDDIAFSTIDGGARSLELDEINALFEKLRKHVLTIMTNEERITATNETISLRD